MKYRQLGKTGVKVPEIGFGTWGLGGDKGGSKAYGPTDDRQSEAALNRAFDLGITFYDTADLYGFGHSESVLGKTFKQKRSQVIIAGKVGFVDLNASQDFSPDYIRRTLLGSLQRLSTDYIDVYQLHSPSFETLERMPEALETMKCLKQEGLVKCYGVSLRSPDEGLKLLRLCPVDCIQVNFNLTDQRALQNGLFDLCAKMGVGVIVRTPLCFGFLTGEYADVGLLAESDHRRKWPQAQVKLWNNASQLFARLLKKEKQTKAQLALRFCLSFQAVSTAIPGMLNPAQIEENAQASRMGALTPEELAEIQSVYTAHDFFLRQ
ncbi:MAG: aldo/keto reductase [Kiritimatiellia bacterium]|nr:aldo/keto reductase [Kiritimatiellia bacterium]